MGPTCEGIASFAERIISVYPYEQRDEFKDGLQ
jgi:hypothetical protein